MGTSKKDKMIEAAQPSQDLTPEEYFLWSQIGKKISLADLVSLCPWPEQEAIQRIKSLVQKKSAVWSAPSVTYSPEIEKQLADDNRALSELDREFRAEVLKAFAEPEDANPYEVLGLAPKSSDADIKQQHLLLSKKFHPDRFFKKNLGHYKQKLETIFTRIQKAHAVLRNPIEKEGLDRTLAIRARTTEDKPIATKKFVKLDKEMERIGKAEHSYKAGLEFEKTKDYVAAYNSFVIAHQLEPKREIFEKAIERIRPLMNAQKAQKLFQQIKAEATISGMTLDLMKQLEEVMRANPNLEDANLWMARFILELGPETKIRDAKEMLLRAKASNQTSAEPCYYLAKAYEAMGELKAASKELDEALRRNPRHLPSKKLLEKLK